MRYVTLLPLALAPLLVAHAATAGATSFDQTVAAQPKGVVDVNNVAGDIEVTGWDRSEVSVHADLSGDVEKVDVHTEGGRTIVKVVLPSVVHNGEAKLHLKIPQGSELDVSAVSADVKSSGILGVQRLTTVSGDVSAELAGSDAELKTVSGDVKLKGHGQAARLHVTTVTGDVHVEHAAGDVEASTVSGTLVTGLDAGHSVRVHTTSGDLRIEGKLARGAEIEGNTVNGDVLVRTAIDGGFGYEVSSFSGDIEDCFGEKAARTSQYAPGKSLQGTRGEGAGHVRLKTMSGDVTLCDHS
jgi:DUF4097 and DUF4098 domain-containing protein YvlB